MMLMALWLLHQDAGNETWNDTGTTTMEMAMDPMAAVGTWPRHFVDVAIARRLLDMVFQSIMKMVTMLRNQERHGNRAVLSRDADVAETSRYRSRVLAELSELGKLKSCTYETPT